MSQDGDILKIRDRQNYSLISGCLSNTSYGTMGITGFLRLNGE